MYDYSMYPFMVQFVGSKSEGMNIVIARLVLWLICFGALCWLIARNVQVPYHSRQTKQNTRTEQHNPHNPKLAYVCLCANLKAIYPTLVLFEQLEQVQAKRGLYVVLISSDIPPDYMELFGLFGIKAVPYEPRPLFRIGYETTSKGTMDRDRILWQKLRVWSMTDWEKIIMLDYDLLILKNFDELFDQDELAGVPMLYQGEKVVFWEPPAPRSNPETVWTGLKKVEEPQIGWTGLNSGVLVLKPDMNTFKALQQAASKLKERPCCPSQEFIFRFFEVRSAYHRLPPIYNLRKMHLFTPEEQLHYNETAKIYHFVEKRKPILMGKQAAQQEGHFAKLWWTHATRLDSKFSKLGIPDHILRTIRAEAIRSAL